MEWTSRPAAPCPSSSPPPALLWDWDATDIEEERGAKRGRQQGGGAAAGDGEARCQVEGCGVELGGAKGYHRKHRVCEAHSKCPRVVVAGQERRFCQQCSRFHALSEFDQKKRSCRRRLSDHNARRRKPQPDVFSFGLTVPPSSLLDDRREISFVWNKAPLSDVKPFPYSSWPSDLKCSQVLDIEEKSIKAGAANRRIHLSKSNLSNSFPTLYHDIDELFPIKGPGADPSGAASKLDGALDVRRALSLLSASSRCSTDPVQQTSSLIQFTDANQNGMMSPLSNGGNSNSPFWIDGQPLAPESQVVQFTMDTGSTVFQDLERIKPAYGSTLFRMNQIH